MTRIRIYHDFNKLNTSEVLADCNSDLAIAPLVCRGTADDLDRLGIELQDGMLVTLYQPDDVDKHGNPDCLEVDAVIRRASDGDFWIAEFDHSQLCYASEKAD